MKFDLFKWHFHRFVVKAASCCFSPIIVKYQFSVWVCCVCRCVLLFFKWLFVLSADECQLPFCFTIAVYFMLLCMFDSIFLCNLIQCSNIIQLNKAPLAMVFKACYFIVLNYKGTLHNLIQIIQKSECEKKRHNWINDFNNDFIGGNVQFYLIVFFSLSCVSFAISFYTRSMLYVELLLGIHV